MVLDAVGVQDDTSTRRQIVKYNKDYDGPIIVQKQGSQPRVEKTKLIDWWNGPESRWEEVKQRERDKTETVKAQHDYGRDGTVLPEIGGHVRRRRSKSCWAFAGEFKCSRESSLQLILQRWLWRLKKPNSQTANEKRNSLNHQQNRKVS